MLWESATYLHPNRERHRKIAHNSSFIKFYYIKSNQHINSTSSRATYQISNKYEQIAYVSNRKQ